MSRGTRAASKPSRRDPDGIDVHAEEDRGTLRRVLVYGCRRGVQLMLLRCVLLVLIRALLFKLHGFWLLFMFLSQVGNHIVYKLSMDAEGHTIHSIPNRACGTCVRVRMYDAYIRMAACGSATA